MLVQCKDFLQLLIEATVQWPGSDEPSKLTDEEIFAHSLEFILAGHDTTGAALSFTAYLLALNPDVQEKLQREIDSFYERNPVRLSILSRLTTS